MVRTTTVGALLLTLSLLTLSLPSSAWAAPEDATGLWLTADKDAAVEIDSCGASLCGRLVWYVEKRSGSDAGLDSKNPDEAQRKRRLCGVMLLAGFRLKDGAWKDGWVYDPESGNTYSGTITPEDRDHLSLRGYIGIPLLGRSERWTRAPANQPRCQS